ncbi:MAG: hypothetical protein ACOZE5_06490 [Verrucomicrobiota bacterium]
MLTPGPVKVSFGTIPAQSTLDFGPAPPKLGLPMASLAQLLASHRRILVLDAASTRVQVGLLREGQAFRWHAADDEAGKAIFAGASSLLTQMGWRLEDIGAFAYCEGPGSMLGVRTVAMTLRTWCVLKPRPVYAYQSLTVAGTHVWGQKPGRGFSVIADARRDAWHCQEVKDDGRLPALRRISTPELPSHELAMPENFRTWTRLPRPVMTTSYDLARIFPEILQGDIFREVPAPDAFQHEAPDYKKWPAQPHSAASVSRA